MTERTESPDLAKLLKERNEIPLSRLLSYIWHFSVPGMLAQVSSILMQYIDAAMVGRLGAEAAASIGLVSPALWMFGGLTHSLSAGFTVQTAQAVGAGDEYRAKRLLRQAIVVCTIFSSIVASLSAAMSGMLPVWLGAEDAIRNDASSYFFIFQLALPVFQIVYLMSGMLQASGDMKTPAVLNALMCAFDVAFNYVFIIILDLGAAGAAYGSACAAVITAALILYRTLRKSPVLALTKKDTWKIDKGDFVRALKIGVPVGAEQTAWSGAVVAAMRFIAPLGAVSLAANSFAVTAESLCYMPGFGIQEAASTLVGQSVGAKRSDLAKRFARLTTASGMIVMTITGAIMYAICPAVFAFLTTDEAVRTLAVRVLRIELFAEPLFAAAIVASGALRGAGDTLIPGIMNLASLWGVRIVLTIFLVPRFGLYGAWIAMGIELCFRGMIFLIRLTRTKWEKIAYAG